MVVGKRYDIGGTEMCYDMCVVMIDVAELDLADWATSVYWLADCMRDYVLVNRT